MKIKRLLELAKEAQEMPEVIKGMTCAEPGTRYHAFVGLLAKEMNAKRIIELGCYIGESTKYMAKMSPESTVIAVDINPDAKRQLEQVEPVLPNIKAFTADSVGFAKEYDKQPIDILFIDANHDYSLTMSNYYEWYPYVRQGGLILMDDWHLDHEMARVREEMIKLGRLWIDIPDIHATGFAVEIK